MVQSNLGLWHHGWWAGRPTIRFRALILLCGLFVSSVNNNGGPRRARWTKHVFSPLLIQTCLSLFSFLFLSHQGLLMQQYRDCISNFINISAVTLTGSRQAMFEPATRPFAQTPVASCSAIRTLLYWLWQCWTQYFHELCHLSGDVSGSRVQWVSLKNWCFCLVYEGLQINT